MFLPLDRGFEFYGGSKMLLAGQGYKKVILMRLAPGIISEVGHPRNIRPPYTLKYMESLLKKYDYSTMLMDCWIRPLNLSKAINESLKFEPDMIVILITTPDAKEAMDYAMGIRSIDRRAVIVAVGQEPTAIPEKYIFKGAPVDFVLKGESELSLIQLLKELNSGRDFASVRGLYSLDNRDSSTVFIDDLNMLPYPRYSREDFKKYSFFYPIKIKKKVIWGHILTSRGCPYDCIFCSQTIRESYGKEVRIRNVDNILEEMAYLTGMGANVISIDDDNFTTSRQHVYAICDGLKKMRAGIKWTAHARIDNVDLDMLKIMKESGCVLLRFGVESGSDRIIRVIKKAGENISDWAERSKNVFSLMKKVGIEAGALFLFGNPSETRPEIEATIRLARELKPSFAQVCFFTAFPGSSAHEKFKDKIGISEVNPMYHYAKPAVNLSQVPSEDLIKLQNSFYASVFLNPGFLVKHFFNYFFFYIFNLNVAARLSNLLGYSFNRKL